MKQLFIDQQTEWRNSLRLMRKIRQEIEKGLGEHCAERKLNVFIEGLLEKYNMDNVSFVVKSVINSASWDGRYDKAVKEWAELVEPFPQPPGRSMDDPPSTERFYQEVERFYLEAHPCYVNEMANRIIKMENSIAQTKDDRIMSDR